MNEVAYFGHGVQEGEVGEKGESWKSKPLWCEWLFHCKWDIIRPSLRSETIHTSINKAKYMWTQSYPLKTPTLLLKCPNCSKALEERIKE